MRIMYKSSLGKLLTAAMLMVIGFGGALQTMEAQNDQLSNSLLGREFWLAIPPMIGDPSDVTPEDLILMITPIRDTRIRVEIDGNIQERDAKALETELFTLSQSGLRATWQVSESEQVLPLGINVSASEPMAVSMYNGRNRAGEAFQAIPANKLGYEYRHMGYYDRNFSNQQKRAGGFIIVATRNGTDVEIELDGIGEGTTEGGRDFIDPEIDVAMNRGDVYMVRGAGEAVQGSFDISGTKITASRPVAVIAFHQQVNVPAAAATAATGGLSEMLPPVNTWGKTHVAFEWQGLSDAQITHYRVVSDERFNEILVRSYNGSNDQLIEQKTANLIDAGDFRTFEDIDPWANPGAYLRDITIWTSEKPFMLMQYSGGQVWAEARPHMTVVPSTDQMVNSAMFITPPESILSKAIRVHMIAESIPDSPDESPFTQIRLNGEALTDVASTLFATSVPGGDFWWASFTLPPGSVYQMDGVYKFNGIITGQFEWGSFSHPIAIGLNDLDGYDKVPPTLSFEEECSSVIVTAEENTNAGPDENPRQIDEGIADVGIVESESSNARLEYISPANVLGFEGVTSFQFRIRPIDPTREVTARVQVLDRAGNSVFETIEIEASDEFLELRRPRDNFGEVTVGVVQEKMISVENPTLKDLEITSVELLKDVTTPFEIFDLPEMPVTIAAGESLEVNVRYIPRREDIGDRPDSVIVQGSTECNIFELGKLFGSGVKSEVTVAAEWDAGSAPVDSEECNDVSGVRIKNDGTARLTITKVEVDSEHYNADDLSVTLPHEIAPNGGLSLRGMCFTPKAEGMHEVVARIFIDDGSGEEPYASRWFGTGTPKVVDIVTDPALPGFVLYDAAPNPVNQSVNNSVQLRYALGQPAQARLSVYDALGNHVLTLVDEFQSSGDHQVMLNTSSFAAGVYSYRLEAGAFNAADQFVVVR